MLNRTTIAELPFASVGEFINGYMAVDLVFDFSGEVSISISTRVVHTFTFKNGKINYDKNDKKNVESITGKVSFKFGTEGKVYFVLGWSGFSIRFFEASIGLFAKLEAAKLANELKVPVECFNVSFKITGEVAVKIGIIRKRTIKARSEVGLRI